MMLPALAKPELNTVDRRTIMATMALAVTKDAPRCPMIMVTAVLPNPSRKSDTMTGTL